MALLELLGRLWPYFRSGSKVLTLLFEPHLKTKWLLSDGKWKAKHGNETQKCNQTNFKNRKKERSWDLPMKSLELFEEMYRLILMSQSSVFPSFLSCPVVYMSCLMLLHPPRDAFLWCCQWSWDSALEWSVLCNYHRVWYFAARGWWGRGDCNHFQAVTAFLHNLAQLRSWDRFVLLFLVIRHF